MPHAVHPPPGKRKLRRCSIIEKCGSENIANSVKMVVNRLAQNLVHREQEILACMYTIAVDLSRNMKHL